MLLRPKDKMYVVFFPCMSAKMVRNIVRPRFFSRS